MADQTQETYLNTLKSNTDFLNSINQERVFRLDKYIICELVALYFFINRKDNTAISSIGDFKYTIEDEYIITGDNSFRITDLVKYITMKDSIHIPISDNTIKLDNNSFANFNNNYKQINFLEIQRMYKCRMRNYLYIEQNLDGDMYGFIENLQKDFNDLINALIKLLLFQNNTKTIDSAHLEFIYGLINFLINISYNPQPSIDIINTKVNEVRIIKDNYQDEKINLLEDEYNELTAKKISYISRIYYINRYSNDYSMAYTINKKIENIDNELHKIETELCALKTNPSLFHQFLVSSIKESIIGHNIELREDHIDPLITIFTNDKENIKSIIETHLSSFINIFNNEAIINRNNSTLKLCKNNEGV